MEQNCCFICAEDCSTSYFYLINLASKKYKTKYTSLIGDLINPEYELRVTNENKICERCSVLIEKYDELQHETKTVKSVLGRQIAHTYSIETNEPMVYMDKSKTFVELQPNALSNMEVKYSCKLCPRYVTNCIDTVNSHILYHKIVTEGQIQTNELLKDLSPSQKRNQAIRRETQKRTETAKPFVQQQVTQNKQTIHIEMIEEIKKKLEVELPKIKNEPPLEISAINIQQEYDEETLESMIDLDMLEDPLYDSNLKNHQCMVSGCPQEFTYVSDYVRHLKLKHKSTLNHIFAVVRANIKRPNKVNKFMCPYCFTRASSSQALEHHVKQHEEAAKSNLFTDRINDFVTNVMSSSRCVTCDCEIIDPTVLECNHEIVKNGMAPKMSCMYCVRDFYSDKLYNNHLALDHGHCFICGSTCDDKTVLGDHIRSHLSHAEYSCTFCNDIYQTKTDRLEHMKQKHHEQCCMYCEEWCMEKDDLEHHIRYSHADKRMEEKPCICDTCGASFKNKTLFANHQILEHQKRKIYTCSGCRESFRFRYVLMEHISTVHKRTIVDNETNFYKCFICNRGFSSQSRKTFIQHLSDHKASTCFCSDCNVNLESVHHLEAHRERSHQDFSILADKKPLRQSKSTQPTPKETTNLDYKTLVKGPSPPKRKQARVEVSSVKATKNEIYEEPEEQLQLTEETEQFSNNEDDSQQQQQQQIMVQTEDGSLLNMNNFILTENGELIIQNLDGLLPNGQEGADDGSGSQIHISNLEQFLMEQGLSGSTEISYIQPDEGTVIIQNDDGTVSQSSQESLMQTYKEIFEPDEDIPTELISSSEVHVHDENVVQSLLLNGDYMVPIMDQHGNNGQVAEQVEVQNSAQVDANQSTLDELGDILLEVAAAAEKEKKPKVVEQKIIRETLWGTRKRNSEPITNNGSAKKRSGTSSHSRQTDLTTTQESEPPASNFSQAYEFFVKGFDAKKHKNL